MNLSKLGRRFCVVVWCLSIPTILLGHQIRDFISISVTEEKNPTISVLYNFCRVSGSAVAPSEIVSTLWLGIALETAGALMLSSSSAFLFLTRKPIS